MKEEVLTAGTTRAEGRSVDTWPVVQHCDEYSTEVVSVVSNLRYAAAAEHCAVWHERLTET